MRCVVPFVMVQFVMLIIFVLFPAISLWLPNLMR